MEEERKRQVEEEKRRREEEKRRQLEIEKQQEIKRQQEIQVRSCQVNSDGVIGGRMVSYYQKNEYTFIRQKNPKSKWV